MPRSPHRLSLGQQQDALDFAWQIADAAEIMFQQNRFDIAVEMKPDDTPVTALDRAIEQMVVREVTRARGEEVLGEEGAQPGGGGRSAVWVVDPIDGTELYVADMAGYVFSLALVIDGQPEVALVRDPRRGVTWSAMAGGGAWRTSIRGATKSQRLRVSDTMRLGEAQMRVPRGAGSSEYLWPDVASTVADASVNTLKIGSVARSGIAVAEGELDGLIFGRSGAWDMAAAALIVAEAGGRHTDLLGQNQRYDRPLNGAILSNMWLHEDIIKIVTSQSRR